MVDCCGKTRLSARLPLLAVALLLNACTTVFFQPSRDMIRTPAQMGLAFKEHRVRMADGVRLHAWELSPREAVKAEVIFLHGNGRNLSYHLPAVAWLPQHGYRVWMLDFRGYGRSQGKASVPVTLDDLNRFQHWYRSRSQGKPLFIIGQSLGGTLACYWLAQEPAIADQVSGLVLDAPFASYPGMVNHYLSERWYGWPLQWLSVLFTGQYDPIRAAPRLSDLPVLFFHYPGDGIVPFEQGQALYRQLPQPKAFVATTVPHTETLLYRRYQKQVLDFMESFVITSPP